MDKKNIHILSTGMLPGDCILSANQNNMQVDMLPFIQTQPTISPALESWIETIAQQPQTVIFTSKQAVQPIIDRVEKKAPDWYFYCIEGATQKQICTAWKKENIIGTAPTGAALAEKIIADHPSKEVIFFCGQRRLNEIPRQLSQAGIPCKEVIVYKTILTPKTIEKSYDGILFYSPSGAESFFSVNNAGNAILFSIGTTTTSKLSEYTKNKIITISRPDKAYMLTQAIKYFK